MRLVLRNLAFLALAAFLAACASTPSATRADPIKIGPGDVFEFEGTLYSLVLVQDDFVLLRYREASGAAGGLSGFLDEVFRVSRYRLGEGRWVSAESMPGLQVQWAGGDNFVLGPNAAAAAPAMGL
jgi:hypothetical protein